MARKGILFSLNRRNISTQFCSRAFEKRRTLPNGTARAPSGGGTSFLWKYVRLESYEDTLNNLVPRRTPKQDDLLATAEAQGADSLKEQYVLRYMLVVETRGSQSLLNVKALR